MYVDNGRYFHLICLPSLPRPTEALAVCVCVYNPWKLFIGVALRAGARLLGCLEVEA